MESVVLQDQPSEARLAPEMVEQLSKEAVQPGTTKDFVDLKGKQIPIKFMPIAKERRVVQLLTPLLPKLSTLDDLANAPVVADEAFMLMPQVVAIIAEGVEGVDQKWIESECSTMELWPVVVAQLEKYGLQDRLGKLWQGIVQRTEALDVGTTLLRN